MNAASDLYQCPIKYCSIEATSYQQLQQCI